MIENSLRVGHDLEASLTDVLTRLPQRTNQDDLSDLLPCNWQPPPARLPAHVGAA